MNALYVFLRVIRQFRRDRRTLALIFAVPLLIMSVYYVIFREEVTTTFRVGAYFRGAQTPFVASVIESFQEISLVKFTPLQDDDLVRAMDRYNLDAALVFPVSLQTDLVRTKTVTYDMLLEGTRLGARDAVENMVRAALLNGLRKRLPMLVPEITFRPQTRWRYLSDTYRTIDLLAPPFNAFFLYFISFLLTCVGFLRERSTGTMERLFVTPIRSAELVLGYLMAFFALSALQSAVLLLFSTYVLGIKTAVSLAVAFAPIIVTVLLGVTMGIFFSTLARNEFQVIQFVPIVIIPQALLCGLIFEVESMPSFLQVISRFMPLTYTTEILKDVLLRARPLTQMAGDFAALGGFLALFFVLSLLVVRRTR